jgi:hypothetical protein
MTQFETLKGKAQLVMTYLLTLVDGTQHTLIPIDPHGTVMEMPEEGDIWQGRLFSGGQIAVPSTQVLMVEQDRYRVRINNGQGYTSREVSRHEVERTIDRAPRDQDTGEVKFNSWKSIKDAKTGETISGDD